MMDLFSLDKTNIVITGGYGHLGRGIVKGLSDAGGNIIVWGRHKEKFLAAFGSEGSRIHFMNVDLTSTQQVQTALADCYAKFGKVDVLINNAYSMKTADVNQITDDEWAYNMERSIGIFHRCIREIAPYFKNQGHGKIINVSSMYGMVSPNADVYTEFPQFTSPAHYGVGKAGILQLTRYFACFLGPHNILVNSVSPGPFPSESVQSNKGFIEALSRKNPLGRIGRPEELVGVFALLCSKSSSYITGQNFVVDGGWTAW